MINEHALTLHEKCTLSEIAYLVKKANHLGKKNREISHVFLREEKDGSHIYFEVEELKPIKEQ